MLDLYNNHQTIYWKTIKDKEKYIGSHKFSKNLTIKTRYVMFVKYFPQLNSFRW